MLKSVLRQKVAIVHFVQTDRDLGIRVFQLQKKQFYIIP